MKNDLNDTFLAVYYALNATEFWFYSSFNPEPSVFPSVVKKSKNENIQDYNFACDFVWVWNLVSDAKGET
jgi:hypothetical protein